MKFSLSRGQAHDAPQGRALLRQLGPTERAVHSLMDRAYEGNQTRALAVDLGLISVVPPSQRRLKPWQYDKQFYKRRNEVERLFHRLKGFRRVFTRYDKLDVMFIGIITFALIIDELRLC